MRIKLICFSLLLAVYSNAYCDEQAAMVRNGMYAGLQFGYLATHYSDMLDRYAAGNGNQAASGSNFSFHGLAGYNFNKIYGVELGLLRYQDSSDGSTANVTRKANIDLLVINMLATFHLKLNESRSWVATPKVGLAIENGKFRYQYSGTTPPPWEGSTHVDEVQTKTSITPTAGVSFDHSFNSQWVMSFAYQYYFGGYAHYDDPYQTPVSSMHYFSVGGIYKF